MCYTHTAAALTHAPEIVLDIGCNRCHRRYHCRRRCHCRHTEQISNIQIFAVPAFPMNWLWLGLGTADKGIEIVANNRMYSRWKRTISFPLFVRTHSYPSSFFGVFNATTRASHSLSFVSPFNYKNQSIHSLRCLRYETLPTSIRLMRQQTTK